MAAGRGQRSLRSFRLYFIDYSKFPWLTQSPDAYTDREVLSMWRDRRRMRDLLVVYLLNVALILLCQQL